MVTDDFDNVTKPIVDIGSFYGEPGQMVEKCLIIFSKEIYTNMNVPKSEVVMPVTARYLFTALNIKGKGLHFT